MILQPSQDTTGGLMLRLSPLELRERAFFIYLLWAEKWYNESPRVTFSVPIKHNNNKKGADF